MLNWSKLENTTELKLFNSISDRCDKVHLKLTAIFTSKLFPEIMPDDLPKIIKYIKKLKSKLIYMALDLSENNVLFLLRISIVAVLLNVGLSLASTFLPTTGNDTLPFKQYDEMVNMLKLHKKKLFSSSLLVALVAAGSVLFLPLLLEHVEFLDN